MIRISAYKSLSRFLVVLVQLSRRRVYVQDTDLLNDSDVFCKIAVQECVLRVLVENLRCSQASSSGDGCH